MFAAALGELGPRLENAILEYAILQHSLCRRAKFSACGGPLMRTASDASTPRGSALCASPRGVLLLWMKALCCKELCVRKRESRWLPLVMLPVLRKRREATSSLLLLRPLRSLHGWYTLLLPRSYRGDPKGQS